MDCGRNIRGGAILVAVAICLVMANAAAAVGKAKCYDKWYPKCYGYEYECPADCAYHCEIDCKTCKPVCPCDKPGAVCRDPRFIGGDGIMFYFHGKKEADFCLVSDSNLHINAHFIGKSKAGMKRDFTWVQSIGVLFGTHQLYVGANKVGTWDESADHLSLAFDGKPILLPPGQGATWTSSSGSGPLTLTITRFDRTNAVTLEVEDMFKITAAVVPITQHDSRIHNYGVTHDDCFAHLELAFKFYSLSPHVTGVLGQTYGAEYKSPVNMAVPMPVLGGDANFSTSNLFATDCKVARFRSSSSSSALPQYASVSCESGRGGRGIVCRK